MEHPNARILMISDMHAPYEHPDTMPFLYACWQKYRPTRAICVGDEVDKHAMSFHDSDPDLPSAGDELDRAIHALQPLYSMFPEMDLVSSNHGSMAFRKAKHHGIPKRYMRDYGEVLEAPVGWRWHDSMLVTLPTGQLMYVCHGLRKDGIKLAQQQGCCVVQGHYHTEFNIQFSSSPMQLLWSMQVGCSVDDRSLALHYNKTTAMRPIIGHGIVIEGIPKLLPMVLGEDGKWTGAIP